MAQQDIKQIRGASQGSILFLGTNSVVSEDFNNLNWNQSNNILYVNGNLQIVDGNQQSGYVLTTDSNGLATWSQSQVSTYSIVEVPISGTQNGVNKDFVLAYELDPPQNLFFINGQLVQETIDYVISGTALTIDSDYPAPQPDDSLRLFASISGFSGILDINGLSTNFQFFTSSSTNGNIDLNIISLIDTHTFDVNINFNDSGTGSNDVWSADQIISYVGNSTASTNLEAGSGITISNDIIAIDYEAAASNLQGNGLTSNNGTLDVNVINGLTLSNDFVALGGILDRNTSISGVDIYDLNILKIKDLTIGGLNTSLVAGQTFNINGGITMSIDIGNSAIITDDINGRGFVYAGDYSSTFVTHSLVDKNYVDNLSLSLTGGSASFGAYWTSDQNLSFMNINVTASGDIRYIDFENTITVTSSEARLYWDDEFGTLNIGMKGGNVVHQIGQDQYYYIKNQSGNTIDKGSVVSFAGTLGNSGKLLIQKAIADGSIPAEYIMGVTTEDILNGEDGFVTEFGILRDIDTTGQNYGETWSDGDLIYLSPTIPGGFTNVEPEVPNVRILMAAVINSAVDGSIFVRPTFLGRITELDDVTISGTISNNSILQYNSTKWENIENPTLNDTTVTGLTVSGYYFNTNSWSASNILTINNFTNSVVGSGYKFNDAGTGLFDIWSADKVIDFFNVVTSGSGVLNLNGLTASIQFFTSSNDQNVKLNINSTGTIHDFEVSWDGLLPLNRGGLSNSTFTASQILIIDSTTSSVVSSGYQFNDSGASSSDIWSADKIIDYVGAGHNYVGVVDEGVGFTDNNNGTITLPDIVVGFYDNAGYQGIVKTYSVTGGTTGTEFPSLVVDDTNYIRVIYNGGNPIYEISQTQINISSGIEVQYLTIYRISNFLHILEYGEQGAGLPNKINNRIIATERFARESGLVLGLSGSTGIATLTGGVAWNGADRQILTALNSADNVFFKNWKVGGNWTYSVTGDFINNQFYNDGTNLVTASASKYLTNWYYRGQELNSHLYEVYGSNQYDSVIEAQLDIEPGLPELVLSHAFLVGRIIIRVGTFSNGVIENPFITKFASTTVPNHNDLDGLQGGQENAFFHLTETEYTNNALKTDPLISTSSVVAGTLTTTSTTDVLMTSLQFTNIPVGRYFANFGTSLSNGTTNATVRVSIYVGGVQVAGSERIWQRGGAQANIVGGVDLAGFPITITTTSTVEVRWRTDTGTATSTNRHFSLLRVDRLAL